LKVYKSAEIPLQDLMSSWVYRIHVKRLGVWLGTVRMAYKGTYP